MRLAFHREVTFTLLDLCRVISLGSSSRNSGPVTSSCGLPFHLETGFRVDDAGGPTHIVVSPQVGDPFIPVYRAICVLRGA